MKLIDQKIVARKMPIRLAVNTILKGVFLLSNNHCAYLCLVSYFIGYSLKELAI